MTKYQFEMLELLKRRNGLAKDDFWEAYNKIGQRPHVNEPDNKKEKIWDFTSFVYSPYYRHWQEPVLARKYEDAFLSLLEDFLARLETLR